MRIAALIAFVALTGCQTTSYSRETYSGEAENLGIPLEGASWPYHNFDDDCWPSGRIPYPSG